MVNVDFTLIPPKIHSPMHSTHTHKVNSPSSYYNTMLFTWSRYLHNKNSFGAFVKPFRNVYAHPFSPHRALRLTRYDESAVVTQASEQKTCTSCSFCWVLKKLLPIPRTHVSLILANNNGLRLSKVS